MGRRSTTDLLLLTIAATICLAVLVALVGILVIEFHNPAENLSATLGNLNDVVNTLIGLLAGFLAGRTDSTTRRRRDREEGDE